MTERDISPVQALCVPCRAAPLMKVAGRALAVVALLGLSACLSSSPDVPKGTVALNTGKPEPDSLSARIATKEHPKLVAAYGGLYRNTKVERRVAAIVGRLMKASDVPGQRYSVTILNSPSVNAFALPGGFVYVTRGLLALANDDAELAAVIAHEMAHVTARHGIARQKKLETSLFLGKIVSSVLQNTKASQKSLEASKKSLASFSQKQELEADEIGVRTTARAGYDPFAASRFLVSLDRHAAYSNGGAVAAKEFSASHPSTPERYKRALFIARGFGAPGIGVRNRDAYLKSLDGLQFGANAKDGFVRGQRFLHPKLDLTFVAPMRYKLSNTLKAVLGVATDGAALRFDAVAAKNGQDLAAYLRSGWVNGLQAATVRTSRSAGLDMAQAGAKAEGWQFQIGVVRKGAWIFRFIFASQSNPGLLQRDLQQTLASFRKLSAREARSLTPLSLSIMTVKPGQTIKTFVQRMPKTLPKRRALFLMLNGMKEGDAVSVDQKVKVVRQ